MQIFYATPQMDSFGSKHYFFFFYRDVKMGMRLSEEKSCLNGKIIPLSLPENR
jgi:hypothetical protein